MRLTDSEMYDTENAYMLADIEKVCKLVVKQHVPVQDAKRYLKEKYGVVWAAFSLDGKAIISFTNGKKLCFGSLLDNYKSYGRR